MTNTTTTIDPEIGRILATGTYDDAARYLADAIREGAWGDCFDFAEMAETFGAPDRVLRLTARALPSEAEAPDLG